MEKIKLLRVYYLPKELETGFLYFSEEYGVAGHLCPCGCGNKIITPIGPTNWSFTEIDGEPTLYPSLGNWQLPCRSHYWITKGLIEWSYQWSEEQIETGRRAEEKRRKSYYDKLENKFKKQSVISRFVNWFYRK